MEHNMDKLLQSALTPDNIPEERLNRQIMRKAMEKRTAVGNIREEKLYSAEHSTPSRRRSIFSTALAAVCILAIFTITLSAVIRSTDPILLSGETQPDYPTQSAPTEQTEPPKETNPKETNPEETNPKETGIVKKLDAESSTAEERYKINIFLSNFSEQWFNAGSDMAFTDYIIDPDQLINFAYRWYMLNAEKSLEIIDGSYAALTFDQVNDTLDRYFGFTLSKDEFAYSSFEIRNQKIVMPFGAGESYPNFSVASEITESGNGNYLVRFKIYSLIEAMSGGNKVTDKEWYCLTEAEASQSSALEYHSSGYAIVRPYQENGIDSYQLVSYCLEGQLDISVDSIYLPKDLLFSMEGMEELVTCTAHIQNPVTQDGSVITPGYMIYFDPEIYSPISESGITYIRVNDMPADYPPCEIEIKHIPGVSPSSAAEASRAEAAKSWKTVSDITTDRQVGCLYFYADDGSNWNSPCKKTYFFSDGMGGTFRITSQYFMEAAEGHGARFHTMLTSFSVFPSEDGYVSGSFIDSAFPPKDLQFSMEGITETFSCIAHIQKPVTQDGTVITPGYAIYYEPKEHTLTAESGVVCIRTINNPEGYPKSELEIIHIPNISPASAAIAARTEMKDAGFDVGMISYSTYVGCIYFIASESSWEWKSTNERLHFLSDGMGGAFQITVRSFVEEFNRYDGLLDMMFKTFTVFPTFQTIPQKSPEHGSVPTVSIDTAPQAEDQRILKPRIDKFYIAGSAEAEDTLVFYDGDVFGFHDRLTWGCSSWCGCDEFYSNAVASSTLESQIGKSYSASNLTEFFRDSTWCEGVEGSGIGETVEIKQLYRGGGDDIFTFSEFCIVNGYAVNEEKWQANNRVSKLKVYYEDTYVATLLLEDTINPQFFDISQLNLTVGNGEEATFRFEIAGVYPGTTYDDTCITGIMIDFTGKYAH